MNRYNHYTQAQYTPMTMQEILQPAMIMRERHDKAEERYGELMSESAKAGFLAENAPEGSKMRRDWDAYNTSLREGAESLSENGITGSTMRHFNDLKRQYSGTVGMFTAAAEASNAVNLQRDNMIASGKIVGFNRTSASEMYDNGLQPPDMSQVFDKQQMKEEYAKVISNYQRLYNGITRGQTLTNEQFLKINEQGKLEGLASMPDKFVALLHYGLQPGEAMEEFLTDVRDGFLNAHGIGSPRYFNEDGTGSGWGNYEQSMEADNALATMNPFAIGETKPQILDTKYNVVGDDRRLKGSGGGSGVPKWTTNDKELTELDKQKMIDNNETLINKTDREKIKQYEDVLRNVRSWNNNTNKWEGSKYDVDNMSYEDKLYYGIKEMSKEGPGKSRRDVIEFNKNLTPFERMLRDSTINPFEEGEIDYEKLLSLNQRGSQQVVDATIASVLYKESRDNPDILQDVVKQMSELGIIDSEGANTLLTGLLAGGSSLFLTGALTTNFVSGRLNRKALQASADTAAKLGKKAAAVGTAARTMNIVGLISTGLTLQGDSPTSKFGTAEGINNNIDLLSHNGNLMKSLDVMKEKYPGLDDDDVRNLVLADIESQSILGGQRYLADDNSITIADKRLIKKVANNIPNNLYYVFDSSGKRLTDRELNSKGLTSDYIKEKAREDNSYLGFSSNDKVGRTTMDYEVKDKKGNNYTVSVVDGLMATNFEFVDAAYSHFRNTPFFFNGEFNYRGETYDVQRVYQGKNPFATYYIDTISNEVKEEMRKKGKEVKENIITLERLYGMYVQDIFNDRWLSSLSSSKTNPFDD